MFKIGDFSKLSRVSVKTLRYYDEIGLLKPRGTDRFTRYRYYSVEQLPVLQRILGLKELGFSLEQIAQLLEGGLEPEQIKNMLLKRQAEIQGGIQSAQAQLAQVQERLRQIEQQGGLPPYEVLLKQVAPQWVAALSGSIPSYEESGPQFARLFAEANAYLERMGCRSDGPRIALYYEAEAGDGGLRVEAALPLPRQVPGSQRVRVYELPGVESMACVVHHGPCAAIGEAYQALLAWSQANHYRLGSPTRELFLSSQPGEDSAQTVTEIQFPVKKMKRKAGEMEPKIVILDPFMVVGMHYLGKNEQGEISALWQEFAPRIPEIRHTASLGMVSYGVCSPNDQGLVDYIAGVPVTKLEDIPPGMLGKQVPAQTYVVFEAAGIEDIHTTYQMILNEWLPSSEYQAGDGPDFEFYPETFEPDDPESTLLIYFPVQKK